MGSVVATPGLSCPEACGIPPRLGTELASPAWQVDSLLSHQGRPSICFLILLKGTLRKGEIIPNRKKNPRKPGSEGASEVNSWERCRLRSRTAGRRTPAPSMDQVLPVPHGRFGTFAIAHIQKAHGLPQVCWPESTVFPPFLPSPGQPKSGQIALPVSKENYKTSYQVCAPYCWLLSGAGDKTIQEGKECLF